jgi:hypothetical protein
VTVVAESFIFRGSSNLAQADYDPETEELVLTFQSGDTYRYTSVPVSIYSGLTRASSAGSYFHRQIRDRYSYTQE